MLQLAAGFHPVHKERVRRHAEILHDSHRDKTHNEGMFKGRWGKTMQKRCIAYACQRSRTYENNLKQWIDEWDKERAAEVKAEEEFNAYRKVVHDEAAIWGETDRDTYDAILSLRNNMALRYTVCANYVRFDADALDMTLDSFRKVIALFSSFEELVDLDEEDEDE